VQQGHRSVARRRKARWRCLPLALGSCKKTFSTSLESDVDRVRDLPYSPPHTHQTNTRQRANAHGIEAAYEFAPHASSSLPFPADSQSFKRILKH
jgi:hypothetical protein